MISMRSPTKTAATHGAALRLLWKVGVFHYYSHWYEHPDSVSPQLQGILKGPAPGMEGQIGNLPDKRPWLVLK
jgi:hypothetical protein